MATVSFLGLGILLVIVFLSDCQSEEERQLQKQIRREEKRLNKKESKKGEAPDLKAMAFDPLEMKMAR